MNAMSRHALPADNPPTTETVALAEDSTTIRGFPGTTRSRVHPAILCNRGLPTFTPPLLASEAKKVRGTRRPSYSSLQFSDGRRD
jgi:hypothetical protein